MLILQAVNVAFEIFYWMMIARVILSWVPIGYNSKIVAYIYEITDVLLRPIKRYLPTTIGGVDFSPIIGIFALDFLRRLVLKLILSLM